MLSSLNHPSFGSDSRVSQSLRNDRCQNILYKAVFEHFKDAKNIAALLLTSKSFQNSSFGANFLLNFVVDANSIRLIETVLSPSSCFSLQFAPSLHINHSWGSSEQVNRDIPNFAAELAATKYFHSSLRSLVLDSVTNDVLSCFFGSTSNAWPQLRNLSLERCQLNDSVLETIAKNAAQLRLVNLSWNSGLTDAGLEQVSSLSAITSLELSNCDQITDLGLEHLSKSSTLTSLNLYGCSKITNAGLERVSKLPKITSLDLSDCNLITDIGLDVISKLSTITSLNLSGCFSITDGGLEGISKLASITFLGLGNCRSITETGLEHIAKLSDITSLDLSYGDAVSDDGLQHLSQLSSMTQLDLSWCFQVTDAGLAHVAKLYRISSLYLCYCSDISDAGLEHFATLPNLTMLNLYGCDKITDGAKKKLQTALPNCEICC